jgi:23S rRNA (uracil1939-C5)-methyltransferase
VRGAPRRAAAPRSAAERWTLVISDLVPGGDGLGRLPDGRIAFVRGGLPGDSVEIEVEADKGSHVFARVISLVTPSPDRVEAPCPIVDQCGGCPLMKLSAEAQARAKESMLRQSLTRLARLSEAELRLVRPLHSVGGALGYRNRLRMQHRSGHLGFFREKSHDWVRVHDCKIASSELNDLLRATRERLSGAPSFLEAVELRVLADRDTPGGARAVSLLVKEDSREAEKALAQTVGPLEGLGVVRVVPLRGRARPAHPETFQKLWVEPETYVLLAPFAFNQVNLAVNERLIELVLERARAANAETFFDLYGGAGNFTLPLLRRGLSGTLVEVQAESVEAARRAAEAQGLRGGEFVPGDVPIVAKQLLSSGRSADVVILDPPRKGALPALQAALGLAKKAILLVSCDPPTFARDLRFLLDRGARLLDVTPLDMFPQTHHLEVLACLDVSSSGGGTIEE